MTRAGQDGRLFRHSLACCRMLRGSYQRQARVMITSSMKRTRIAPTLFQGPLPMPPTGPQPTPPTGYPTVHTSCFLFVLVESAIIPVRLTGDGLDHTVMYVEEGGWLWTFVPGIEIRAAAQKSAHRAGGSSRGLSLNWRMCLTRDSAWVCRPLPACTSDDEPTPMIEMLPTWISGQ